MSSRMRMTEAEARKARPLPLRKLEDRVLNRYVSYESVLLPDPEPVELGRREPRLIMSGLLYEVEIWKTLW